jgi:hypothetical protein
MPSVGGSEVDVVLHVAQADPCAFGAVPPGHGWHTGGVAPTPRVKSGGGKTKPGLHLQLNAVVAPRPLAPGLMYPTASVGHSLHTKAVTS